MIVQSAQALNHPPKSLLKSEMKEAKTVQECTVHVDDLA